MSPEELGREHVIALVFGLLGVIQGLAFTKLAEKMPTVFGDTRFSSQVVIKISYFCVGFLIVVRVFQTYASGAVTYAENHISILELYAIFAAGLLQYWVLDAFKSDGTIEEISLFRRVKYLALLAIGLHLTAAIREIIGGYSTNTQIWNVSLAGIIFAACMIAPWVNNYATKFSCAVIICISLAVNTWHSLGDTDFGAKPENFEQRK